MINIYPIYQQTPQTKTLFLEVNLTFLSETDCKECESGDQCNVSISHHARSLDGLGDDPSVRFTPEHVTFELLRAAVHDHCEGVAVVTDAQKGEEAYLTLPEGLVAVLSA